MAAVVAIPCSVLLHQLAAAAAAGHHHKTVDRAVAQQTAMGHLLVEQVYLVRVSTVVALARLTLQVEAVEVPPLLVRIPQFLVRVVLVEVPRTAALLVRQLLTQVVVEVQPTAAVLVVQAVEQEQEQVEMTELQQEVTLLLPIVVLVVAEVEVQHRQVQGLAVLSY